MPTKALSVGTTVEQLIAPVTGFVTDFVVQNLSANTIYIGDMSTLSSATGIKVVAGGFVSKDRWEGGLWIIADGATSDVRFMYQQKNKAQMVIVSYMTAEGQAATPTRGVDP